MRLREPAPLGNQTLRAAALTPQAVRNAKWQVNISSTESGATRKASQPKGAGVMAAMRVELAATAAVLPVSHGSNPFSNLQVSAGRGQQLKAERRQTSA
jgi:hypothetical protein